MIAPRTPFLTLIPVFVALIFVCCALWRVGLGRALGNFGNAIIRILSRGGIRLPDLSEKTVMGLGAVTLVALFVPFIIFALRVH